MASRFRGLGRPGIFHEVARPFGVATIIANNKNIDSVVVAQGETRRKNLQKSGVGCFVFSLAHAKAIQSLDIYDHLKRDEVKPFPMGKISTVNWTDFPPEIIVYSQSTTCWADYKERYQEKFQVEGTTLTELSRYRDEMCAESAKIDIKGIKHPGNFIPFLFQNEMLDLAISYVEEIDEEELKAIVGNGISLDEDDLLRICMDT